VTVKTFSLGEQRLETRLFMRHEDGGWGGYTYEWNEAGTDAVLLPAAKLRPLEGDAAWTYPSRPQCIQCHSRAAGSTLGLETAQLNRDAVYKSTNRISSQLATLEHIGVIAAGALPVEPPRLVSPIAGSDASIEARARAYLHANCSHCHRPMGGGQGMMDLRYDRSLRDTVTCNVDNTQGSVAGAVKLIAPGVPEASVLLQRMRATDSKRMPPVAVAIPDPTGTAVVEEWIRSLPGCP
jgi:mono/diheme cytochrome c family protein